MDWPNTDCARSSYILRCLATSARKLALEQMRAPEPLGRARRVHVLTRDAPEVRLAAVAGVALERPQHRAGVDRCADRAHSHHAVDGEGRVGIERGRTSGRDNIFMLEGTKGTDVRGAVAASANDRHSEGAGCLGRGPRARRKYLRKVYEQKNDGILSNRSLLSTTAQPS